MKKRSKIAAGVLAILLGGIGVHKFYLGKITAGVLSILFCWTGIPAIIALIEGIIYLTMSDSDFERKFDVSVEEGIVFGGQSKADELLKWQELYEKGTITSEEFYNMKEKLMK